VSGQALPPLPEDIVGALAATGPDGPSVIPVSALHRASDGLLLFALAPHRATLRLLREDDRAAIALLGPDLAVTAHGRTRVVADPLPGAPFVVALALRVTRVQDTLGTRTVVHDGVRWGWRDADSAARHARVLDGLRRLADAGG